MNLKKHLSCVIFENLVTFVKSVKKKIKKGRLLNLFNNGFLHKEPFFLKIIVHLMDYVKICIM